jgi:hypothetical protein
LVINQIVKPGFIGTLPKRFRIDTGLTGLGEAVRLGPALSEPRGLRMGMTARRRNQLMVRWSILTASAIAAFWGVWFLATGAVPVVTEMRLTAEWAFALPFGVSRLWDILLGPIGSTAVVLIACRVSFEEHDSAFAGLTIGALAGLVVASVAGFLIGALVFGLATGFLIGIVVVVAVGLFGGLRSGLYFGFGYMLGMGLILSLVLGVANGLLFAVMAALVGASAAAIILVAPRFKRPARTLGGWLAATPPEEVVQLTARERRANFRVIKGGLGGSPSPDSAERTTGKGD